MGSKLILLSKKIKNFVFFKIPSFKIDNILGGSCPHLWVCNPPTRKWPKFFLDERPLYEHCAKSAWVQARPSAFFFSFFIEVLHCIIYCDLCLMRGMKARMVNQGVLG